MNEIWISVENYVELYRVSSLGQVFSIRRNKLLKLCTDSNGYSMVVLSHKGIRSVQPIHRLVASAFIPNLENKPLVCHKDDDPKNNSVDNLFWGTYLDNMQDRDRKGRNGMLGKPNDYGPRKKRGSYKKKSC